MICMTLKFPAADLRNLGFRVGEIKECIKDPMTTCFLLFRNSPNVSSDVRISSMWGELTSSTL
jgi:hypothetical protein